VVMIANDSQYWVGSGWGQIFSLVVGWVGSGHTKWTHGQLCNTSELRRSTTVVYCIDRQALSTARFYRANQFATTDTLFRTCRTSSFCTFSWQLAIFQPRGPSAIAEIRVSEDGACMYVCMS